MKVYAVITHEDQWFVATAVPNGVVSQGKSVAEAKRNLREALELYYEDEPIDAELSTKPLLTPIEVTVAHG